MKIYDLLTHGIWKIIFTLYLLCVFVFVTGFILVSCIIKIANSSSKMNPS